MIGRSVGLAVGLAFALAAPLAHAQSSDWQAGAGDNWRTTMEAAKKEGKVVVAGHPALSKALSEAFERDTGITLEYLGGETNELVARLTREIAAGNVTIDIMLGGLGGFFELKDKGELKAIKPQLMLPQSADGKYWKDGAIKWCDEDGQYMLEAAEWVHGWPLFNTNMVKPGEIKNWKDMLKPQYTGKIAAYDPRPAGQGQSVAALLTEKLGVEFLTKLFIDQKVTYTRDGRQIVEWAARGTYPIVLGAVPVDIEFFKKQGIKHIEVALMDDAPGSVLGGFSVVKEPKQAPHPAATTVFLNWFASRPGQEAYSGRMLDPSRRTDVNVPGIPEYAVPKPGVKYIDQYAQRWYLSERPKIQKQITEALGGR